MSRVVSERVLNLYVALITTRRFLSKEEIRSLVAGYADVRNFDRTFERDKERLREAGAVIVTGSNDPDSEAHHGYRIERSAVELPEIDFTRDELIALGLASRAWEQSVAARATASAVQRLRAAGAEPEAEPLEVLQPSISVGEEAFDTVHQALFTRTELAFDYAGARRRLQPWRLIQVRGHWLVRGYDLDREAQRTFRLSRISSLRSVGAPAAYEIPEAEVGAEVSGIVAVRRAPELAAGAEEVPWAAELPEGFRALRVVRSVDYRLVEDVCAAGGEAIALDPPELVADVVERLSFVEGAW